MSSSTSNKTVPRLEKLLNKSVGQIIDEFHFTYNFPQDVPYIPEY